MYVFNDGGEVDLALGHYERYLNVTLSRDNNITTGKIYSQVIEKEVSLSVWTCRERSDRSLAQRRAPRQDGSGSVFERT